MSDSLQPPWTVAYQAPQSLEIFQARVLEWVAISSSRGSSWPRDRTWVSRITGRRFTIWAPRDLQLPDILWIHWRVYNSIANTSKGVLFLPPSDVYVRSFLYLLYTLIIFYYTKSSEKSSLISGLGLNSSPPEAKNPGIFSWFSNNISEQANP